MAGEAAPAPAAKKKAGKKSTPKKPTAYVVLRQVAAREMVEGGPTEIGPDTFEFLADVEATSAPAAKKAVFATIAKAQLAAGGGELVERLVAVPASSWTPKTHRQVLEPKIIRSARGRRSSSDSSREARRRQASFST